MIDLSQEQEQKSAYGPVPSGSRVLVRLSIEKPKYASHDDVSIHAPAWGATFPCFIQ